MRVVAIVQARMGSSRLAGKVLFDLGGMPVLGCVTARLQRAASIAEMAIATSSDPGDDPIEAFGRERGVCVIRGSLDDVLARYAVAAEATRADAIVRITADCPLIDPEIVDAVVGLFLRDGCEYASNTLERSFPRGLDTEVFTRRALERAASSAREPYEREHVTPYVYRHAAPARIGSFVDPSGVDRSAWRWTLDTLQDYTFLRALVQALAPLPVQRITTADAIAVLERDPELLAINADVVQKALDS